MKREELKKATREFLEARGITGGGESYAAATIAELMADFATSVVREAGWVPVAKGLPERVPNKRYSTVPCIVTRNSFVEILVFNHEHECWDDASGDDNECAIEAVAAWMPLPSPYRTPEEQG
jgi:malate/lactate dehydrogenase